jgi:hypothetical protein
MTVSELLAALGFDPRASSLLDRQSLLPLEPLRLIGPLFFSFFFFKCPSLVAFGNTFTVTELGSRQCLLRPFLWLFSSFLLLCFLLIDVMP